MSSTRLVRGFKHLISYLRKEGGVRSATERMRKSCCRSSRETEKNSLRADSSAEVKKNTQ